MKKIYLIVAIGLMLFVGGCATNPIVYKEKELPRNSELLIGEFGYWKRDCTIRHFDIYIKEYPQGGDLRFEVGSLVIPEDPIIGSSGECVGQAVQSKKVYYKPNPDFVGSDSVTYVVRSSRILGNKSYAINLDVQ